MVVCISAEGSQDDAYLDGGRIPLDPDQVKQRIPLLRDKVNAVVATLEAGSAAAATAFLSSAITRGCYRRPYIPMAWATSRSRPTSS